MKNYNKVTRYFVEKKDLRGYVKGSGWAHSVAHTAEAFDDLTLWDEIGYSELIIEVRVLSGKSMHGRLCLYRR